MKTKSRRRTKPNKDALTTRVTKGGLFVCRLHYAADQFKNPENYLGLEWLREALNGYSGGMEDPNWLKEMEIQYSAGMGQKVFQNWHNWLRSSEIFVSGEMDVSGAKIYGSYDHGYANPACYLVHAIYPDGMRRTIWEFYANEVPVHQIAEIILGKDVKMKDGRKFQGNPYAHLESFMVCDPEICRRTQVMNKGPNKSVHDLFRMDGVLFSKGESGDDVTVANWLSGNLWLDPGNPEYQIHRDCKNLIWELGRLQRKSWTVLQARTKNQPEVLLDKDNHAWDALKYWLKRFPVGAKHNIKEAKQADFAFWRDRKKSKIKLSYAREFAK